MKAALITAFIALFVSMVFAQATSPYYITNPIQGSSFAASDVLALQWNNGVGTAKITVLTGTNSATMKSAGISFSVNGADGGYDWTVPSNLAQNATFAFQIDYKETNGTTGTVYSAPFTLTGTTGPVVTQSFVTAVTTAMSSAMPSASMVSSMPVSSVLPSTAMMNATSAASSASTTASASTTPTPAKSAAVAGFKVPTAAVCVIALIASALFL